MQHNRALPHHATRGSHDATRGFCDATRSATRGFCDATRESCSATHGFCDATHGSCSATRGSCDATRGSWSAPQGSCDAIPGSPSAPRGFCAAPRGSRHVSPGSRLPPQGSNATPRGSAVAIAEARVVPLGSGPARLPPAGRRSREHKKGGPCLRAGTALRSGASGADQVPSAGPVVYKETRLPGELGIMRGAERALSPEGGRLVAQCVSPGTGGHPPIDRRPAKGGAGKWSGARLRSICCGVKEAG